MKSKFLNVHNQCRANHNLPPMEWDDELENSAGNNNNIQSCNFAHSNGDYGENIADGYQTVEEALYAWYNEGAIYRPGMDFNSETGHYTQMCWKGTTKVGCAAKKCGRGYMVFCQYLPRGNVRGQFQSNVPGGYQHMPNGGGSYGTPPTSYGGNDSGSDEGSSYGTAPVEKVVKYVVGN